MVPFSRNFTGYYGTFNWMILVCLQVVEAFLLSHPESKVSKSCVRDKIAELCEYNSLQRIWVLKADVPGSTMAPHNTQKVVQSIVDTKASKCQLHMCCTGFIRANQGYI